MYTICVATQIVESPAGEEFRSAVGMLKLLGDETRLRVIWVLLEGEHSVNELAEVVGAQPAAVSQHLAKLRLARLVRSRREGRGSSTSSTTPTCAVWSKKCSPTRTT